MLTHTLIPRYLGRNIRVSSVKRNVTALDTQRNPKNRIQTRKIFYVFNSLWNLYGPRKKKSTPFEPGNTEVRYTRDNVWVRAGHENGTILIGITEQAKELLRPSTGMDITRELGSWGPSSDPIAAVKFYHPDDVEHNRPQKEILEWPLVQPTPGYFDSVNPKLNSFSVTAPDLGYRNWLFSIEGVSQWDWNGLLTEEEYLDYVMRTGNLLGMRWTRSQYASIWNQEEPQEPETIDHTQAMYDAIRRQKDRDERKI